MLSLPGQPHWNCEGVSRREWLRVGGLGAFGLSLPRLLSARAAAAPAPPAVARSSFGRARSCIVLFMFGAPAHQDLWDLKPHAPSGIRGEFQPIPSSVPDVFVGEHLPKLAQRVHEFAQIRSVTHLDNTHTVAMHHMLTGRRHVRPATNPQNAPDDFPCFGAVMNHEERKRNRRPQSPHPGAQSMPAAISLNAPANQVSANNHIFPGFFAGFLGGGYDPMFVPQNANAADFRPLPPVDSASRLLSRQALLSHVEQELSRVERTKAVRELTGEYAKAFDVLTTPEVRR
ncbi:MAG: DUF1501 domain-containing protein, partial [Planctomycetota bacterium]|nr:DUF1501 domain-containing protein [Planctomycetota bacterium]